MPSLPQNEENISTKKETNYIEGQFDLQSASEFIEATIDKIIFANRNNDYTVATVDSDAPPHHFTVVGLLGNVQPGDTYEFKGSWEKNNKYGKQFKVDLLKIQYPKTEKGIINFLSSGRIKGIGKGYAKKIVDYFGSRTIHIISHEPFKLNEVPGLGKKRVDTLLESWKENYQIRDIMMFLQGHEISANYANKIYRSYGDEAIETVKENPYRLASDITGIGFLSADKVANSMGFDSDCSMRIEAGIVYLLSEKVEGGHVFYPQEKTIKDTSYLLEVDSKLIDDGLKKLFEENRLLVEKHPEFGNILYLPSMQAAEDNIAQQLNRIKTNPSKLGVFDAKKITEEMLNNSDIEYSLKQQEAIEAGLNEKILIITGGPGTGKTTVTKTLVDVFSKLEQNISLAAPTGRAAKRLGQATNMEATTIHRLLEYNPGTHKFTKCQFEQLDSGVVIVDESSMIDQLLMSHLLSAIDSQTILILVGDIDQLPSVGPGNILKDIIESKTIHSIALDHVYRQAENSAIILNAHRINNGEMIHYEKDDNQNSSFFFIQKTSPEAIVDTIKELVCNRIPNRFGLDIKDDIQVLSPMYRTQVGVDNLNKVLQEQLNTNQKFNLRRHLNLAIGDKVMQTSNNYDKEIFNGDIGYVENINTAKEVVNIRFESQLIEFEYHELDSITLAYAITIHKSQGSEYGAVVIPVSTSHYTMLQRNLLYTAITRGKTLVVLVGQEKALSIAIKNNNIKNRYTNLKRKLQKSDNP